MFQNPFVSRMHGIETCVFIQLKKCLIFLLMDSYTWYYFFLLMQGAKNVQVCDATGDEICSNAGNKKCFKALLLNENAKGFWNILSKRMTLLPKMHWKAFTIIFFRCQTHPPAHESILPRQRAVRTANAWTCIYDGWCGRMIKVLISASGKL